MSYLCAEYRYSGTRQTTDGYTKQGYHPISMLAKMTIDWYQMEQIQQRRQYLRFAFFHAVHHTCTAYSTVQKPNDRIMREHGVGKTSWPHARTCTSLRGTERRASCSFGFLPRVLNAKSSTPSFKGRTISYSCSYDAPRDIPPPIPETLCKRAHIAHGIPSTSTLTYPFLRFAYQVKASQDAPIKTP